MDMHRKASKHKQSHAMHTHTHTHARDTVRCAPLELLSILFPPLPALHLLFHSIFVLYPNNSNRRTLDGTPNKCLNIYFYINRNNFWVFLFVIRFSLSYLLFTFFYACVFRSFVDWVFTFAQRVCSVSLRSLFLFLARSLSINCILLICQNILPNTRTH